jgi:hypothetical protein
VEVVAFVLHDTGVDAGYFAHEARVGVDAEDDDAELHADLRRGEAGAGRFASSSLPGTPGGVGSRSSSDS